MNKILERLEYGLAGAFLTLAALYFAGHEFVDNAAFGVIATFAAVKVFRLYSSRALTVLNSRIGTND